MGKVNWLQCIMAIIMTYQLVVVVVVIVVVVNWLQCIVAIIRNYQFPLPPLSKQYWFALGGILGFPT